MGAYDHVPGQRDFLILDKEVSLTEIRRKPSAVWKYLETPGYIVFITRRGKPICRIVSIETYACMTTTPQWRKLNRQAKLTRNSAKHHGEKKDMNQKIRDYVATRKEPIFFSKPDDEEFAAIHTEIQRGIETATDVMIIEIDQDVMVRAQAFLATIGWTLEEACILFLYWIIECPKEAEAWDKAHENRGEQPCSTSQETPMENSAGSTDSANA